MSTRKTYRPKNLSYEGLPNRLRRYRIEKGYTLGRLAETIEVSPQAVHEAETKGTGLSRQKWYRLADLFDCDPRVLESPEKISPKYQVTT